MFVTLAGLVKMEKKHYEELGHDLFCQMFPVKLSVIQKTYSSTVVDFSFAVIMRVDVKFATGLHALSNMTLLLQTHQ